MEVPGEPEPEPEPWLPPWPDDPIPNPRDPGGGGGGGGGGEGGGGTPAPTMAERIAQTQQAVADALSLANSTAAIEIVDLLGYFLVGQADSIGSFRVIRVYLGFHDPGRYVPDSYLGNGSGGQIEPDPAASEPLSADEYRVLFYLHELAHFATNFHDSNDEVNPVTDRYTSSLYDVEIIKRCLRPSGSGASITAGGGTERSVTALTSTGPVADNPVFRPWQCARSCRSWPDDTRVAPALSAPAAVKDAAGRLDAFAVGDDGAIYRTTRLAADGPFQNWTSLGGISRSRPVVGRNTDGRLQVFVLGTDWRIYTNRQTTAGGSFEGWGSIGAPTPFNSAPSLATNADGRLEVFVVGQDFHVYHAWQQSAGGPFTGWERLGGDGVSVTGQPAVASNSEGRLEVAVLGTNGSLYHAWQTAPGGGFSSLVRLGDANFRSDRTPAIGRNGDGRLEVFTLGLNGAPYHLWQCPSGCDWAPTWTQLDHRSYDRVESVASNSDGRLEVSVVKGTSVYRAWQCRSYCAEAWHPWSLMQSTAPHCRLPSSILLGSGLHTLQPRHSNKCLTIQGRSYDNGAAATQVDCLGSQYEQFFLTQTASGLIQLQTLYSGKCLAVSGASTEHNAHVVQWDCSGVGSNGKLYVIPEPNGNVRLMVDHSRKCLAIRGSSMDSSAQMVQEDCGYTRNQLFRVQRA